MKLSHENLYFANNTNLQCACQCLQSRDVNAHTHTSDCRRHQMSSSGHATLYTEWLGAYVCILTQILSGYALEL